MEPNTPVQDSQSESTLNESDHIEECRYVAFSAAERLYQLLRNEKPNLAEDEYSRMRSYLDDLTKQVVRIPFVADEEVVALYEAFEEKANTALRSRVLAVVMPSLESLVDLTENDKITFDLNWVIITLIWLTNYLGSI